MGHTGSIREASGEQLGLVCAIRLEERLFYLQNFLPNGATHSPLFTINHFHHFHHFFGHFERLWALFV
ncbi:unnamed protein product, partial [Mesorhabditis belari]|uniref:Uncharacterized protein n=1 Tax=Mesorhabditis belari TaxID=2138241 RepID=A0AAF3J7B4_9BILA